MVTKRTHCYVSIFFVPVIAVRSVARSFDLRQNGQMGSQCRAAHGGIIEMGWESIYLFCDKFDVKYYLTK